jgi:serine/threonine protein phosphatase PrpC
MGASGPSYDEPIGIEPCWAAIRAEIDAAPEDPRALLRGVAAADAALSSLGARSVEKLRHRVATLTALLVSGSVASLVHVGLGRGYRIRGDDVTEIAEEHSLAALYRSEGRPEKEIADAEAHHSAITMGALGLTMGGTAPRVDAWSSELEDGDAFLLCTDGFWRALRGPIPTRIPTAQETLDELFASLAPIGDDATAVLVRVRRSR